MARDFGPFPSKPMYEVVNRRMQRALAEATASTGFAKPGQGAVTAGTGAELVIAAYPDGALVDGLYVENPASETVTLTTNTASSNPRIDRLVMRLDMAAETIAPFQIVGTPAASPQIPPLVRTATVYDMPLVQYRFPGSASAQNPGSIVDERLLLGSARTDFDAANRRLLYWNDTRWVKAAGPVEVLYENGNVGASGFITAGDSSPVISPINVSAPVAADTAHVHLVMALISQGTSAGRIIVTFAGEVYTQNFDVGTTKTPIPIDLPLSLPAGTSQLVITLACDAGSAVGLTYSAVRVTI